MKFEIVGFNQVEALELTKIIEKGTKHEKSEIRLDVLDLVILRWFVDYFPTLPKIVVNEVPFCNLSGEFLRKVREDLPMLNLKERAIADRFIKMGELGVLKHITHRVGGTYALYTFGENYELLIDNRGSLSKQRGGCSLDNEGRCQNNEGVVVQTTKGAPIYYSTYNELPTQDSNNTLSLTKVSDKENKLVLSNDNTRVHTRPTITKNSKILNENLENKDKVVEKEKTKKKETKVEIRSDFSDLTITQQKIYAGVSKIIYSKTKDNADLLDNLCSYARTLLVNKKKTSKENFENLIDKLYEFTKDKEVQMRLIDILRVNCWSDLKYAIEKYKDETKRAVEKANKIDYVHLSRNDATEANEQWRKENQERIEKNRLNAEDKIRKGLVF